MKLNRIISYFKDIFTVDVPRPIVIMDWFGEKESRLYPIVLIRPKRTTNPKFFQQGINSLIDGELFVDVTDRRVYQKLNGEIVEWKMQTVQNAEI